MHYGNGEKNKGFLKNKKNLRNLKKRNKLKSMELAFHN